MTKIDHAAVRTAHYEEAQKFFEDVFDMHMWREIGEKPGRKCWFKEGIQLCETSWKRSKHILLPLLTTTGSPFQMEQRSN